MSKKHTVCLHGIRAIVLFPTLTSPALVHESGCLDMVIAVHKDFAGKDATYPVQISSANQPLTEDVLRKMHSHIALVEWGNKSLNYINDSAMYTAHFSQLSFLSNLIYGSHDKFGNNKASVKGWYLGELPEKTTYTRSTESVSITTEYEKDYVLKMYDENEKLYTFGVLHADAIGEYRDQEYMHLFQLRFKNIPSKQGLYELAWMFFDHEEAIKMPDAKDAEDHLQGIPGDDFYTKILNSTDRSGVNPEYSGNRLLKPCNNIPAKIVIKNGQKVKYNQFRVVSTGPSFLSVDAKTYPHTLTGQATGDTPKTIPEASINSSTGKKEVHISNTMLPFMDHGKGEVLTARHPVYFSNKHLLDIGVAADLHISSKQAVYRLSRAQVIPFADEKISPYIGAVASENLQTSRAVMGEVLDGSDVLLIPGDAIDHTINCNPMACAQKINDSKGRTGAIWHFMDYKGQFAGGDSWTYPRYGDLYMFLSIIYEFYNTKRKPIFFNTGNHDAYDTPYGISPRVLGDETLKANGGIPADHNLSILEATLLYGPSYPKLQSMAGGEVGNLKARYFKWCFLLLSPWRSCNISYGDNQRFCFLDWGDEEAYLLSTAEDTGSLPRASDAMKPDNVTVLKEFIKGAENHKDATNILVTHFPIANYQEDIPFNGPLSQSHIPDETDSQYNLGSCAKSRDVILEAMRKKKIHYAISGHAHRAGVYLFGDQKEFCTVNKRSLKPNSGSIGLGGPAGVVFNSPVLTRGTPVQPYSWDGKTMPNTINLPNTILNKTGVGAIGLVCGATGTYSKQNLHGEFMGLGMDMPQGLVLSFGGKHLNSYVNFVRLRGQHLKPRMATVADYLWEDKKVALFSELRAEADSSFMFTVSDKVMEAYGSNPVDSITIVVFDAQSNKSQPVITMGCLTRTNIVNTVFSGDVVCHEAVCDKTMNDFITGYAKITKDLTIENPKFFCSLTFKAPKYHDKGRNVNSTNRQLLFHESTSRIHLYSYLYTLRLNYTIMLSVADNTNQVVYQLQTRMGRRHETTW